MEYKQNKIPTLNYNGDGKSHTHEVEMTFYSDKRPYWEQLGFKSLEDYENTIIIIDIETGKQYNFNTGKEIKDGIK